jgi:hypothetical protein
VIITCLKCFRADDVQPPRRLPDQVLHYRCTNATHGDHEWLTTLGDVPRPAATPDLVTDDLLEPLADCVRGGEPFVEYGIVEHRLRRRYPGLFAAHVAEQGHSMFGPRPYTASSVRFGVALGRLERAGRLISEHGPATGAWHYNGQVTYWAKTATPERRTWAGYCAENGRSPDWTDDDRRGLSHP